MERRIAILDSNSFKSTWVLPGTAVSLMIIHVMFFTVRKEVMWMTDEQLIKLYEKLSEVSERIARIETMLVTQDAENVRLRAIIDEHEERIGKLEETSAKVFGVREFIAWAIAVVIGIAGVIK